jgi:excisionase family DNA binding protein
MYPAQSDQRDSRSLLNLPTNSLLTSEDVCRVLKIRRLFLYELLRRNELKSIRVGRRHRFLPSVIVAYIERGNNG